MVHKLMQQFLSDVEWGELDYLLVDMPPGTGDAQLSLANLVPVTGAVLVTTPQSVSSFDVGKAINMFREVKIDVIGIVENMSGMVIAGRVEGAPAGATVQLDLGRKHEVLQLDGQGRFETTVEIFGQGGAANLCQRFELKNLGSIPLHPDVLMGGDDGAPIVIASPQSIPAKCLQEIAGRVAQRVAIKSFGELPVLQ